MKQFPPKWLERQFCEFCGSKIGNATKKEATEAIASKRKNDERTLHFVEFLEGSMTWVEEDFPQVPKKIHKLIGGKPEGIFWELRESLKGKNEKFMKILTDNFDKVWSEFTSYMTTKKRMLEEVERCLYRC